MTSMWRRVLCVCVIGLCAGAGVACGDDGTPSGGDGSGDGSGEAPEFPAEVGPDDGATGLAELVPVRATIGPEGGTLTAPDDSLLAGVSVVVPPGALTEPVELELLGVVDPTDLPEVAAAIGPQIALLPEGLTFAVPVQVTVPFDAALRSQWETADEECKVWVRDGEGWSREEPVATGEGAVTIELDASTTFAAGVFRTPLAIGCRFNCSPPPAPVENCLDGTFVCLERIGQQHVRFQMDWSSYTQGVIYWLTSPASGQLALAGFDVLNRRAVTTSGSVQLGTSASPTGEVVVATDGARWLGFRHRANVRFEGTRLGQAFDSFTASSDPRALGVAFNQATREVVRVRAQVSPASQFVPLSQTLSTVEAGQVNIVGLVRGSNGLTEVLQTGRTASTSPTLSPLVTTGQTTGVSFGRMRAPNTFNTLFPLDCGFNLGMREVLGTAVPQSRTGWAMLCLRTDNRGALYVSNIGTPRASFDVNQTPRGPMAMENDTTVWMADRLRPQLTRFGADGGVTLIPLTSAATGTPEYTAMVPIDLHYDSGLDTLYLVTTGTGGVREFWAIDNLP